MRNETFVAASGFTRMLRLLVFMFSILTCASLAQSATPNVLLIIADDFGQDSCALYNSDPGASLPPTPNLTALAQRGVLFRNAYASPTCSPSRACLMTGQHAFRHGIGHLIETAADPRLTPAHLTLPEVISGASGLSYEMAQFGKWHLNNQAASPGTAGGWPHFSGSLTGGLASYTNWSKTINGVTTAGRTVYATTDTTDDAVSWISARGSQPWFAWVAYNAPHTPYHKPPNALHSYDSLAETVGTNKRPYYEAAAEAMDTEMGRLLAAVDPDNTWVIFVGDNGTPGQVIQSPHSSTHGKDTLYEGGIKVPLIIAGPGVASPGRTCTTLVHITDLFSTITDLIGAVPAGSAALDSRSLLSLLTGVTEEDRLAYTEQFGGTLTPTESGRTLRDEHYKLIKFADGHEELYDLESDPGETANLLGGTLTSEAAGHYADLKFSFGQYQTATLEISVLASGLAGSGFEIRITPQTGFGHTLWRSESLASESWRQVSNAILTTEGATLLLRDPTPPVGSRAFYRVLAEQ